ncbi:MAG: hypothetical protein R2882_07420 [Gemmatimonadales bacterium]
MSRPSVRLAPGAVALLAAAACGRAPARHLTVVIDGLRFVPETLRVAPGDTVTRRNTDIVPHTATADAMADRGCWRPQRNSPWAVRDSTGGGYRCRFHPDMRAVLGSR